MSMDGKYPKTCKHCGKDFMARNERTTGCFQCYYTLAMEQAESDFAALAAKLTYAGFETAVWQTGGMVMCLAARPEGSSDWKHYALFGEDDRDEERPPFSVFEDLGADPSTSSTDEDWWNVPSYEGDLPTAILAALVKHTSWKPVEPAAV